MEASLERLRAANVVLAATSGPEEYLELWATAEPDRLLLGPIFPCIDGNNPNWHQYRCFRDSGDFPDITALEAKSIISTLASPMMTRAWSPTTNWRNGLGYPLPFIPIQRHR